MRLHPWLPYLQLSERSDQNWMCHADDKVKQRVFQQSRGRNSDCWSDLVRFRTHLRIHPCPYYLQVSERFNWNWMSYVDDKVKQRLFQQSRGHNSKNNHPICPGFGLFWDFIHIHLIRKFHEDPIKTEWVMLMTKSNRDFFKQSRGRNSKINETNWLVLELIWGFIHVNLICKFQEDPIKTEQVTLLTVKQRLFSAIKGMLF